MLNKKFAIGKKGILLKFVLGLVIGILVLAGLIYTIVLISNIFLGKQEELQAKGMIENIKNVIIKANTTKTEEPYLLIPLKDWSLVFIPKNVKEIDKLKKPDLYFGQDIVCICKGECK